MSQADQIREFVIAKLIGPARLRGQSSIEIRAGDVHHNMGLANAYPAVCSALRGKKLHAQAGITLVGLRGPSNGGNVWFTYDLVSNPLQTVARNEKTRPPKPTEVDQHLDYANSLVLISCTKAKLDRPAPARDLYISAAFRMKRDIVENNKARWVILSAKYGVIEPEELVAPYDVALSGLGLGDRRKWANAVACELFPLARKFGNVISLAGSKYTEFLVPFLIANGVTVQEPLKGLRQGEQLAWLSARA